MTEHKQTESHQAPVGLLAQQGARRASALGVSVLAAAGWLMLLCGVAVVPALAQDESPPAESSTSEAAAVDEGEAADAAGADDLPPVPAAADAEAGSDDLLRQVGADPLNDLSDVEEILDSDVELRAGGGDRYDGGTRRDPFRSLVRRREVQQQAGPRPEGKPGLLIDEIFITGIFNTHLGDFAQVRGGSKDKSYLLQAGDQLFDGDVISIGSDHVVFRQIINDPEAIKPFREVTKPIETEPQ